VSLLVPNDQVVAVGVERVDVEAVGALRAGPESFRKDLEPESLGVLDGGGIGCQRHGEAPLST